MRTHQSVNSVETTVARRLSHIAVITRTVAEVQRARRKDPMVVAVLTGTASLADKEEVLCA